jgi:pimeloyl-ACP methyl ester carboxylesterase
MAPVRQQAKIPLSDCGFATYTTEVLCGKLEVFEDPAARTGRKITLDIVLLPASDAAAEPEPIFSLAGGPGQGAARIAGAGEDALMSQLRRRRDLVFIDQRGTGSSQALHCNLSAEPARLQSYFDELFPVAKVRACRAALEPKSDLRLYATPMAVADLEAARMALGYEKINLHGVSYGTLVALRYLKQ